MLPNNIISSTTVDLNLLIDIFFILQSIVMTTLVGEKKSHTLLVNKKTLTTPPSRYRINFSAYTHSEKEPQIFYACGAHPL